MPALDFLGAAVPVLVLASFLFTVWMLVDCLKHPAIQGTDKLIWVLVIFLFNVFGAVAYYVMARPLPTNES